MDDEKKIDDHTARHGRQGKGKGKKERKMEEKNMLVRFPPPLHCIMRGEEMRMRWWTGFRERRRRNSF